ncbi:MAG: MFS transporter [Alphaproteobacteria bacterium]|nr:MFS transporter [Alphaproteobacteria bacterium]
MKQKSNTPKKLTRDIKLLLVFSAMRNITDLFLGTFLISFIMHISSSEIISVGMYRMFEYIALFLATVSIANLCKRYSKTVVFALNQIPKIALLTALTLLGDQATEYIIPLGILYGIGEAMYHLPMSTMVSEKTNDQTLKLYMGAKTSINYTVRLIVPVILGFFIDTGSFAQVANVLLVLSVIELILCAFLTPSRHRSKKPADLVGFTRCMFRFPVIRRLFVMEISRGFSVGMLATVITMYTVFMFKSDLNLGILTTVFALFSIVSSWALGKYVQIKDYARVLLICLIATFIAIALFIYQVTPVTFLIYNFVYSTAYILSDQIGVFNMYRLSNSKCVTSNHRVEYLCFCENALLLGRWGSCLALIYFGMFGGYESLRWYLALLLVAVMISGLSSYSLLRNKNK